MRRKRTALALYVLLLALPTLVLGALLWNQLERDQQERLAAVPLQVRDAASRLNDAIAARLEALMEAENRRGFEEYRWRFSPRDAVGARTVFLPSPLVDGRPPQGVLAWFNYRLRDGVAAPFQLMRSAQGRTEEYEALEPGLVDSVARLVEHDHFDGFFRRITRASDLRTEDAPLPFVALNASRERDVNCLIEEGELLDELWSHTVLVRHYDFHLRFYREPDGTARIVATRPVVIQGDPEFARLSDCFRELADGDTLMQGFFIDPGWLFGDVPMAMADGVLEGSMEFLPAGTPLAKPTVDQVVTTMRPVVSLGFETYAPEDEEYGALQVAVSTRELRRRFAEQNRRFLALASMLLVALATGLALLLRSVRRDLEQAARTENFVAAVTHELRTPVSAIRLYGEMLHDGWATGPEKQREYHARIVAESARLETLVERVLRKAQLDSAGSTPDWGDLNEGVQAAVESLVPAGGPPDLALELAPDLPPTLIEAEALGSIVVNLVENARKYAPVRPGANGHAPGEPILVRTALHRGAPVIEVLDRGPGIADAEKQRVFEAFYRIGNETTRTARGTGLGLHLVRSQAESLGGSAEVHDRPGGGSVFRVTLRGAPGGARVDRG